MKQQLFDYFSENHSLLLLENEQQTVIDMVLDEGDTHGWTQRVEKGEPVLCVVWDEDDDPVWGITLNYVTSISNDRYFTEKDGSVIWYDYAEPVSDALVRSYQRWGKWINV